MIKIFMRKTFYQNISDEEYESLWKLTVCRTFLRLISMLIFPFINLMIFVPIIILDLSEPGKYSFFSNLLVDIFFLIYELGFLIILIKCPKAVTEFSMALSEKIYFKFVTIKGEAVSKKDFVALKKENYNIYYAISTGLCQGYCYSISFVLLKFLQQGHIEWWAVECFDKETNDGLPYTMHAIYVNNGWAFDTFCARQLKVDSLMKIYKAKRYKIYYLSDIENLDYNNFIEQEKEDAMEWCKLKDCYISL